MEALLAPCLGAQGRLGREPSPATPSALQCKAPGDTKAHLHALVEGPQVHLLLVTPDVGLKPLGAPARGEGGGGAGGAGFRVQGLTRCLVKLLSCWRNGKAGMPGIKSPHALAKSALKAARGLGTPVALPEGLGGVGPARIALAGEPTLLEKRHGSGPARLGTANSGRQTSATRCNQAQLCTGRPATLAPRLTCAWSRP